MTAIKAAGNVTATYNSNDITAYCNQADLQATVEELDSTNFGSTAMTSDPGLPSWSIQLGGDWNSTIDGYLGPDTITPAKRTFVIAYKDGASTVSYTWTTNAFITNFNPNAGAANGKLQWSATLRLSGNPTRSVA